MRIALNDTVHIVNDGWIVDGTVSGLADDNVDVDYGDVIVRYSKDDMAERWEYYSQDTVLTPTSEGTIVRDYRTDPTFRRM